MPDDTATLIEIFLPEVDKVQEKEDLYSVLWDFGGQSDYYATHPLFLTPSQNPHERAKSVMKQAAKESPLENLRTALISEPIYNISSFGCGLLLP